MSDSPSPPDRLSALPNELLSKIWCRMWAPEDIESFGTVSQHMRSVGKSTNILRQHKINKAAFSTLTMHPDQPQSPAALLLKEALLDQQKALHVRNINVQGMTEQWWDPADQTAIAAFPLNRHSEYSDEEMALFEQAIQTSTFYPKILRDNLFSVLGEWMRNGHSGRASRETSKAHRSISEHRQ